MQLWAYLRLYSTTADVNDIDTDYYLIQIVTTVTTNVVYIANQQTDMLPGDSSQNYDAKNR